MEIAFTWFTYLKAINDVSTDPVVRIILVPPFNISFLPEVVDELFRVLEGADRFPSADESRQLRETKRCRNDLRVFAGVIVPFPLNSEAQQRAPMKAVRCDEP